MDIRIYYITLIYNNKVVCLSKGYHNRLNYSAVHSHRDRNRNNTQFRMFWKFLSRGSSDCVRACQHVGKCFSTFVCSRHPYRLSTISMSHLSFHSLTNICATGWGGGHRNNPANMCWMQQCGEEVLNKT